MSELTKYDDWLKDRGPAALVIREHLVPVEGPDGVFFPATFAAAEDKSKFAGGYNIDVFPDAKDIGPATEAMIKDGRLRPTIDLFPTSPNVCLVDSVGSQANRIEPIFADPDYAGLVPQVVVKAGDEEINLLKAGHRAGDALVRSSGLRKELQDAFKAVLRGNAEPLAKVAPTSLVFGVWDSRDTQAKLPRLVASTIRAFDVRKLTRSAQYVPATEYVARSLLAEPADKKTSDAYAERGFVHVPATGSHGGITATAGIRRDATLQLAALRLLRVGGDRERTLVLRRYILGLALTSLTARPEGYLRQGCNLVPDTERPAEFKLVRSDGVREDVTLTHEGAIAFARAAAEAFGIAPPRTVDFDTTLAEKDVKGELVDGEESGKKRTTKKK